MYGHSGSGVSSVSYIISRGFQGKQRTTLKKQKTTIFRNCILDEKIVLKFIGYSIKFNIGERTCRLKIFNK